MLSRLSELQDAAGAGPPPDLDIQRPPSDEKDEKDEKAPKEECDIEWVEFVAEQKEIYKVILEDEGITVQSCGEVKQRVDNMMEIVQMEKEALLPTKLAQLASRFESQELVCQRMIKRAKEALTELRNDDQDFDEDDLAPIALNPVRTAIAKVRALEFKALVQRFFAARSSNREEMMSRAARQLRYAYPDAHDDEISDILEFPELAFVAITRRLENGSEVALDGIMGDMEGRRADSRKLEQGAKELKLMFLQFSELIDTQGENLTAIEANIKTVIEETTEAIGILVDAEGEKRAYERKMLKFYFFIFLVLFYFVLGPIFFQRQRNGDPCYFVQLCGMIQGLFASLFGGIWKNTPSRKAVGLSSESTPAASTPTTNASKAAAPSLLQFEPTELDLLGQRRLHSHTTHQLAAGDPLERPKRSSGFISKRAPVLDNPVLRSVAVLARGGAARHSAFRRPKAEIQQENSTASSQ